MISVPEPKTYYVISGDLAPNAAIDKEILRKLLFSKEILNGFKFWNDAYQFTMQSERETRKFPIYKVRVTGSKGIIPRKRNAVEIDHKAVERIEVISCSFDFRTYNLETVEPSLVQSTIVEPTPTQTAPVETTSVQLASVQPTSATLNTQAETFLSKYGKKLLFVAAYLAISTILAMNFIPEFALAFAAKGYVFPAAFAVSTSLALFAAAGTAAAIFYLGCLIYSQVKSAWNRWYMGGIQLDVSSLTIAPIDAEQVVSRPALDDLSNAMNLLNVEIVKIDCNELETKAAQDNAMISANLPSSQTVIPRYETELTRSMLATAANKPVITDVILTENRFKTQSSC